MAGFRLGHYPAQYYIYEKTRSESDDGSEREQTLVSAATYYSLDIQYSREDLIIRVVYHEYHDSTVAV